MKKIISIVLLVVLLQIGTIVSASIAITNSNKMTESKMDQNLLTTNSNPRMQRFGCWEMRLGNWYYVKFIFRATDSDGDRVRYLINWEEIGSSWMVCTDWVPQNIDCTSDWIPITDEPGTVRLNGKAQDEHYADSNIIYLDVPLTKSNSYSPMITILQMILKCKQNFVVSFPTFN